MRSLGLETLSCSSGGSQRRWGAVSSAPGFVLSSGCRPHLLRVRGPQLGGCGVSEAWRWVGAVKHAVFGARSGLDRAFRCGCEVFGGNVCKWPCDQLAASRDGDGDGGRLLERRLGSVPPPGALPTAAAPVFSGSDAAPSVVCPQVAGKHLGGGPLRSPVLLPGGSPQSVRRGRGLRAADLLQGAQPTPLFSPEDSKCSLTESG